MQICAMPSHMVEDLLTSNDSCSIPGGCFQARSCILQNLFGCPNFLKKPFNVVVFCPRKADYFILFFALLPDSALEQHLWRRVLWSVKRALPQGKKNQSTTILIFFQNWKMRSGEHPTFSQSSVFGIPVLVSILLWGIFHLISTILPNTLVSAQVGGEDVNPGRRP